MSDAHFIWLVICGLFIGKGIQIVLRSVYLYYTSEAQDGDQ